MAARPPDTLHPSNTAKKGRIYMKNLKHYGKRWLAMVLSLVMCLGLLQTTALAASWNPGDKITINVRVFDESTGKVYDVGTDYAVKGDVNIQSVNYQIPQLTKFVNANQFGRVTKVVGNWYFPSGDSQPGANVEWSCNVSKVTMTYWVNWFSTGSGTGGNTSDTIDLGGSGRNTINFTIRYHSNYPTGTNYTATKKYTVKNYATIYNVFSSQFLTYTDCGFGGFTPKATEKTWYTSAACTTVSGTIGATNGGVYDLYAGWESVPEPVQTLTLTYKDGSTVYRTISGFSSGDDTLLLDCTIEKAGYTFEGWSETSGSATAEYKAGEVFKITKNTTLYAVWTPVQVTPSTTTLTIKKLVAGDLSAAQLPAAFTMNATIINGSSVKSVFLNSAKLEDTVEISTDVATMVVFNESGYAVDGYDCTSAASNGSAVVNGNVTITVPAGTASPVCSITNTYVSNVEPNKQLTGIDKERLTAIPSGVSAPGVNLAVMPAISGNATSVKLLYAITVRGEAGAKYSVFDEGADLVAGSEWSGEIGSSGEAIIYVTKTYTLDDIAETGVVENVAYVKAGEGTNPIPNVEEDPEKGTPSDPVSTRIVGKTVTQKDSTKPDENRISQFTVTITNKTGLVLTSITVKDVMENGMKMILGNNGLPEYDIILHHTDGQDSIPDSVVDIPKDQERTTEWTITGIFEPGAEIVLRYSGELGIGLDADKLHNYASTSVNNGYVPTSTYNLAEVDFVFDSDWDLSSEAVCEVEVPATIE